MNDRPTLVAVASDGHTNSMAGLCPPVFRYNSGAEYHASPRQAIMWGYWRDLWREMREKADALGADLLAIHNGDGPDRNKHADGYGLISMERDEIVRLTVEALKPMRDAADVFLMNRGTEAHEGGSGELCELVAYRLSAYPNPETQESSWYWPQLEVSGVLCSFGHHPISNSTREHTRGSGANRTAADLSAANYRMGDRMPQVSVFSHVHHWEDSGLNHAMRVLYTPAWKLPEAFSYRKGFGYKREPLGAWWWVCDDGRIVDLQPWKREMSRPQVVVL